MTALKSFIMEQVYVIKKSVDDFRLANVTPNILELIETLIEKICYLMKKNKAKAFIVKSLTENQAADLVKTTTTSNCHQEDTPIQTEELPETRPH